VIWRRRALRFWLPTSGGTLDGVEQLEPSELPFFDTEITSQLSSFAQITFFLKII
jgi:hypothetical protein